MRIEEILALAQGWAPIREEREAKNAKLGDLKWRMG